jgi:Porin subfamily
MQHGIVGLIGLAALQVALCGNGMAADAPAKPAPAEDYLRICSEAGEGFFTLPGSDACLKIGGNVASVLTGDYNVTLPDAAAWNMQSRGRLEVSSWQETGFGTLESFVQLQATTGNGPANYQGTEIYARLGGFTVGKTGSIFDFYNDLAYNVYGFDPYVRTAQTTTEQITYLYATDSFDIGVSLENRRDRDQGIADGTLDTDTDGNGVLDDDLATGPLRMPDVVGRVRYSGEVFSAQLMGALHENRGETATVDPAYGFAVGAGLLVNTSILAGGSFTLEGVYADGAASYTGGFSEAPEAYLDAGGTLRKAKSYSIAAEYLQGWNDSVKSTVFGSYFHVTAPSFIANDLTEYVAGANLIWTLVPGMDVVPQYRFTRTEPQAAAATDAHEVTLSIYRYF